MPRAKTFDEQAVLEKAMQLFWKKGFYATSIQDLVDHLGINRASLYDTFGGKGELYNRAFAHYKETSIGDLRKFLFSFSDVRTGFNELFKRSIEQSASDLDKKGCFVVNATVELLPNQSDYNDKICSNNTQVEQIFREYLNYGIESDQISKDLDIASVAKLFFTVLNGLKVVTKAEFNPEHQLNSISTLLKTLNQ